MATYYVEADDHLTPPAEPRWLVKRAPPEAWEPRPFHQKAAADEHAAWLNDVEQSGDA